MACKKSGRCLNKLFEVTTLFIRMEIVNQEFNQNLSPRVCGEGPRRRRYGRTAALRLIVQPVMKTMMIIFCPFPSNGAPVE
jgi:hypothetical protein